MNSCNSPFWTQWWTSLFHKSRKKYWTTEKIHVFSNNAVPRYEIAGCTEKYLTMRASDTSARKIKPKNNNRNNILGVSCSVPINHTFTYFLPTALCLPYVLLPLQHVKDFLVALITLPRVNASLVGRRFVTDRDVMRPLAATRVTQAHTLYFLPIWYPLQCEQDKHNAHYCRLGCPDSDRAGQNLMEFYHYFSSLTWLPHKSVTIYVRSMRGMRAWMVKRSKEDDVGKPDGF